MGGGGGGGGAGPGLGVLRPLAGDLGLGEDGLEVHPLPLAGEPLLQHRGDGVQLLLPLFRWGQAIIWTSPSPSPHPVCFKTLL